MNIESSFKNQLLHHSVAIISLAIGLVALFYSTWRNETTEHNYNMRAASFEVLLNLGQLQVIINNLHYNADNQQSNPLVGWGHVALINDLSELLPEPVPSNANKLTELWGKNWKTLKDDEALTLEVSASIDETRASILKVLKELN